MSVASIPQKLRHLFLTSIEFREGFFSGLSDGARSSVEDLALSTATSVQKVTEAARALAQQRPEKALELFASAFKRLSATERARTATELDPPTEDWHGRGYAYGHFAGYYVFDKVLMAAVYRVLQTFRWSRSLQRNTRKLINVSQGALKLADRVSKMRDHAPA